MKKWFGLVLLGIVVSLFLTGCCGKEIRKFSDGNLYKADWCVYDKCQSYGDRAKCYKGNEYITTIYPFSKNELKQYYISRGEYMTAYNEGLITKDEASLYMQQAQTYAQQRQAQEASDANLQRSFNNLQMQQLNNNLMMQNTPVIAPIVPLKRGWY